MNWEAMKPLATLIFTSLLKIVGGALMTHGIIKGGAGLETFTGVATTAAGAFWSWWVQKGHVQAGEFLKQITQTATNAAAIEVAKRMQYTPAVAIAATDAKASVAAAKAAVILLAVLLGSLALPSGAHAQTKRLTGNIVNDIAAATGAQTSPKLTGNAVIDLTAALDAKLLPDLQYALKLATASGSKVTAPCFQAWIDIINTRLKAVQDDGTPPQALPLPDPHLITDFEKLVEIRNALQPESPFMISCSPVASMVKLDIAKFMGVVISGGVGLATLVPGL